MLEQTNKGLKLFGLFKKKIAVQDFVEGMYSIGMNNLDRMFVTNIAQAFGDVFYDRPDRQGIMDFLSSQNIQKDDVLNLIMRINCYQMMLIFDTLEHMLLDRLMRNQLVFEQSKYASDAEDSYLAWKYNQAVDFDFYHILGETVDPNNILYLSLQDAFVKNHMDCDSGLWKLWLDCDQYNLFINYGTVVHKTLNEKNLILKKNKIIV